MRWTYLLYDENGWLIGISHQLHLVPSARRTWHNPKTGEFVTETYVLKETATSDWIKNNHKYGPKSHYTIEDVPLTAYYHRTERTELHPN